MNKFSIILLVLLLFSCMKKEDFNSPELTYEVDSLFFKNWVKDTLSRFNVSKVEVLDSTKYQYLIEKVDDKKEVLVYVGIDSMYLDIYSKYKKLDEADSIFYGNTYTYLYNLVNSNDENILKNNFLSFVKYSIYEPARFEGDIYYEHGYEDIQIVDSTGIVIKDINFNRGEVW